MKISRPPADPRVSPITLRKEFLEMGLTDYSLRQMVRHQTLARVRHGAYVSGAVWADLDPAGQHEVVGRAVLRQGRAGAVLSHTSALPFWDCPSWGLDLSTVHVTRLDRKAGRAEAGVRQHRGQVVAGDVVRHGDITVMSPARAALESTTMLTVEAAVVQLSDLLHRRMTTTQELTDRYEQSMEHWPRSLNTDLVLRLVDARLESVGESRTWFMLWRQRIATPVPQFEIKDARGDLIARVDFAWPERGVYLEFDGRTKYTALLREGESVTDVVLREKQREELIHRATGWRCIRISWADLDEPEQTALMIKKILDAGRLAS